MNETMQDMIDELRRLSADTEENNAAAELENLANRMQKAHDFECSKIEKLAEQTVEAEDAAASYRQQLEALMHLTEPEAKPWLSPSEMVTLVHCDTVKALTGSEAGRELRKDIREIERIVKAFEDAENNHHRMYGEPLSKRVHALISFYQRTAATALSNEKAFRDDMLIFLRAFELNVQMAGNGGTHTIKNNRLTGLSELLESAAHKIQNARVEFGYHWYDHVDVFKTDYPVRQFVDRIHELERENEQLKASVQPVDANG